MATLPSASLLIWSATSTGETSGCSPQGSFAAEGLEPPIKTAAKTIMPIDGNGHRSSLALCTHDIGGSTYRRGRPLSSRYSPTAALIGNSLRSKNILAMDRPSINGQHVGSVAIAGRKRFGWGPRPSRGTHESKRLRTAQRVVASRGKWATQPSRPPRDCDRARPKMTRVSPRHTRWLFVTNVPFNGSERYDRHNETDARRRVATVCTQSGRRGRRGRHRVGRDPRLPNDLGAKPQGH